MPYKQDTRNVVISGFLGSGKTTLLKRLLDREFTQGNLPQVIMSEFGGFDVDSLVVADERLQISCVISGCVCCSNHGELAKVFTRMLDRSPERPLFIETKGLLTRPV